ncbi:MAG: hypothetical protein VCC00_10655 [Deltaproteobacteria bacterium]
MRWSRNNRPRPARPRKDICKLILEIRREPSLGERVACWEAELLEIFRLRCERAGSSNAEEDAWLILSVTRGVELGVLAGSSRSDNTDKIRATLVRLLELLISSRADGSRRQPGR